MAGSFPSIPLYILIVYLVLSSIASSWLCVHFTDLIFVSTTQCQMWFFLSIFLTNNIFATVAAFTYWTLVERQESIRANESMYQSQSSTTIADASINEVESSRHPYSMIVSYYDNINYDSKSDDKPSLL